MAKHAIRQFESLRTRTRGRIPSLFLDFDGTLAPIVDDPAKAALMPGIGILLRDFAKHTEVAIISGRSLSDLERKIQISDLSYVGAHGLQIRLKDSSAVHEEIPLDRERMDIRQLTEQLLSRLHKKYSHPEGNRGGVRIEPKGACVAVHYREADPDKIEDILAIVDDLIRPYNSLRKLESKMAVDIRPNVCWDKGSAVNWLLANTAERVNADAFPIYIGDDVTDQDAFRVVKTRGVGVYVGPADKRGDAEYHLDSPAEVQEFLSMLLDFFLASPHSPHASPASDCTSGSCLP